MLGPTPIQYCLREAVCGAPVSPWTTSADCAPSLSTLWCVIAPSLAEKRVVRFPSDVIKATVFVGVEANGRFTPVGSGFFVTVSHQEHSFPFVVTADHVVDLVDGDAIWIRINRRDGGSSTIRLEKRTKISHKIRANDIAMFSIDYEESLFDTRSLPLNRQRYDADRNNLWIEDVGDEVASVGLYSTHHGEERNLPVVRVGNISLMPGEMVYSHRGYVLAYLIEIRSIAGLSGSPVYVNVPPIKAKDGTILHLKECAGARPLGMLTGFHMIMSSEDQIQVPQHRGEEIGSSENTAENINTGFAVVVPWERLLEITETEGFGSHMDRSIEHKLKQSGAPRWT